MDIIYFQITYILMHLHDRYFAIRRRPECRFITSQNPISVNEGIHL